MSTAEDSRVDEEKGTEAERERVKGKDGRQW